MRSVINNRGLDYSVASCFPTKPIYKWAPTIRTGLEVLVVNLKRTFTSAYRNAMTPVYFNHTDFSHDDFDWQLNDFACENESQRRSMPYRAWKRHSAVLMLAQEVSAMQSKNTESMVAG